MVEDAGHAPDSGPFCDRSRIRYAHSGREPVEFGAFCDSLTICPAPGESIDIEATFALVGLTPAGCEMGCCYYRDHDLTRSGIYVQLDRDEELAELCALTEAESALEAICVIHFQ